MDLEFQRLTQLSFGYWNAQPLFVMAELDVFNILDKLNTASIEKLAEHIQSNTPYLEGLLNAGVAQGILSKNQENYSNSTLSERFLISRSQESLLNWVRVMGRWVEPWTQLKQVIVTGNMAENRSARLGEDKVYTTEFILGMHEYARRTSDLVAQEITLPRKAKLVDVGGGAGTYSIALCKLYEDITCTLIDVPFVTDIAITTLKVHGFDTRVSCENRDYSCDAFGSRDQDAILFSNVLHQESPQMVKNMLKRGSDALVRGGQIVVHGHFINADRTSPSFSVLHNLSAYVLWGSGRSYTVAEMKALMEEVGLKDVHLKKPKGSTTELLIGYVN